MKGLSNKVTMIVQCFRCETQHEIRVWREDYLEYISPNRRNVQEIFPYLTVVERELLVSHLCENCWNELFGCEERNS